MLGEIYLAVTQPSLVLSEEAAACGSLSMSFSKLAEPNHSKSLGRPFQTDKLKTDNFS